MVVSNIFYVHPYLGKWSNLTNIFQRGWNHQLVIVFPWKKHITGETSRIAGASGRPRGDGERQRRSAADDEGAKQYEAMGNSRLPSLGLMMEVKKPKDMYISCTIIKHHNNNNFFSKKHVMQRLVGRSFMAEQ